MDKKRLAVLVVCLTICLAINSMAIAATIPSGTVTYWDGHYLAGQPVQPGFDIFGWNFQARIFEGPLANSFLPWEGYPPYEGERAIDEWMRFQWNEAYLSNQDGNDPDTHLDFHPFVDWPGANHDTADGDWQGSGAVCWANFSYSTEVDGEWVPVWTHMMLVAVPLDAYLELLWGSFDDCWCGVWYQYEGGPEIGVNGPIWPAGDRYGWAEVKQITVCDSVEVCNYDSPSYSAGLGGPGGR